MMKKSLLVIFLAALVLGWGLDVSAVEGKADSKAKQAEVEKKTEDTVALKKVTFLGPGIDCNLCAKAIKEAFAEVKGVECVHVDVKSKLAAFCFIPEETSWEKIGAVLGEAGYESKFLKLGDAECPCDDGSESCKYLARLKAKESKSCEKKGCPFAKQCKKVCK